MHLKGQPKGGVFPRWRGGEGWARCLGVGLALWLGGLGMLRGAPGPLKQFDVFAGYDGVVVGGAWVPVSLEIMNEGPTIKGVLEIRPSIMAGGTKRMVKIELPTGTRKRLCVPVFVSAYYGQNWDVVLRDEAGKVLEERLEVRPRTHITDKTVLLGALPKSVGGMPVFPEVARPYMRYQPLTARLTAELFPDHPLAMEGLTGLYLNMEKAGELREAQARALVAWVQQGGHLIIGLHAPSDVQSAPWLQRWLPVKVTGMVKTDFINGLRGWTRQSHARLYSPSGHDLAVQPGFEQVPEVEMGFSPGAGGVVTTEVLGGRVLAEKDGVPLVVSAKRGRGLVTVLTFAPELEPFRAWPQRGYFFAKLMEIPPVYYATATGPKSKMVHQSYSGFVDRLMAAFTDSRQIRKLPVGWLVVLLMGYLVVIGPVDYFLLRKWKRPMLTWITFPAYVIFFSGLIYWVGYKLRAGEMEWNEFHVADVHGREDGGAQIRGWNYVGAYAPENLTYPVASAAPMASLRDEYRLYFDHARFAQKRAEVYQEGDTFRGALMVPVWTSQTYVEEYWQPSRQAPLTATAKWDQGVLKVEVRNALAQPLAGVWAAGGGWMGETQRVAAGTTVLLTLNTNPPLSQFLTNQQSTFFNLLMSRPNVWNEWKVDPAQPQDWLHWTAAASLLNLLPAGSQHQSIMSPVSFDLSACYQRGEVVVLAAVAQHSPKPMLLDRSTPVKRGVRQTVYRLVVPAPPPPAPAAPAG